MPIVLLLLFGFLLLGASSSGKRLETEEERKQREFEERIGKQRKFVECQQTKQEQERAEAERKCKEAEETAKREKAQRLERLRELSKLYEASPHYVDENFLRAYATKYRDTILRDRDSIIRAYVDFHRDTDLIDFLEDKAPHLIEWVHWRAKVLTLAEKIDVETPPPPPRRKKPTPEEVTTRMVARLKMKLRDQEAVFKAAQGWMEEQEEEMLAGIDDEDEREVMRNKLKEILGKVLSDFYGKENDNGSTRL